MQKKFIVSTSINPPTTATLKFITFTDWTFIMVGDLKTPHHLYEKLQSENPNFIYLSPEYQKLTYTNLSDSIGWNKIQRRTIGYIDAYNRGADVIASVDDDNIPYDTWGKNILIGKPVEVYYYEVNEICFDPLVATNYSHLWHRGFPLQLLKNKKNYKITRKIITPDIQANFWNGDPDIDAVCRLEHSPMCIFDDKYFPFSSNVFSPFNQQNTILSRKVIEHYLALPYIGRMDDIWPAYYVEALGFNVIYDIPTVFQDRNVQNLTKNMKDEFIGYEYTEQLLKELKININNYNKFLPENAIKCIEEYKKCINEHISSSNDKIR